MFEFEKRELLKRSFKGNREVDKHMERQRGESTKSLTKRAFREAQSISGAAVLLRVSTNFLLKKYPELCAEFRKVNEKVKEVDGILIKKVGKKLKEGNLKIKVFKDIQGRGFVSINKKNKGVSIDFVESMLVECNLDVNISTKEIEKQVSALAKRYNTLD